MPNILELVNAKRRRLTRADKLAINRAGQEGMLQEVMEMERRANDLGLIVTARALNNTKNALGWELAGDLLRAGKAARGVKNFRSRVKR